MSTPRSAPPRNAKVLPDAKFGDLVISKFMNTLMERGKKSVAERGGLRSPRRGPDQAQARSRPGLP